MILNPSASHFAFGKIAIRERFVLEGSRAFGVHYVYSNLVGSKFAELPAWAAAWRLVDPSLLTITDLNFDGIVQLAEIAIGGDIIVLATPEIAGLPYVVSGLVAAGRSPSSHPTRAPRLRSAKT